VDLERICLLERAQEGCSAFLQTTLAIKREKKEKRKPSSYGGWIKEAPVSKDSVLCNAFTSGAFWKKKPGRKYPMMNANR